MTLRINSVINAEVYFYTGTERKNAVNLFELGDRWYPGNPLRITSKEDLMIIVVNTKSGSMF